MVLHYIADYIVKPSEITSGDVFVKEGNRRMLEDIQSKDIKNMTMDQLRAPGQRDPGAG